MKKFILSGLIMLSIVSTSHASLLISDNFSTGPFEEMVASFVQPGATSENLYDNFVRVQISGTGQSNGPIVNDAFYYLTPSIFYATTLYISFTGDPRRSEADGVVISPYIKFVDGQGYGIYDAGEPGYNAVVYQENHSYDFIIDVGNSPKRISLGTGDGGFYDNSGQYNIRLAQAQAVPEPATIFLLSSGLLGIFFRRKLGA